MRSLHEMRVDDYRIMGEFVERYEREIRPAIKRGDVESVKGEILWQRAKFDVVRKNFVFSIPQAFARYAWPVAELTGLVEQTDMTSKEMQDSILRVNRDVAELNFILLNNKSYQQGKKVA